MYVLYSYTWFDYNIIFIVVIACPPIEPLADGQVVVSGSGLGDTATYSCNEGFILSDGFTVRVCKEDHEWTGRAGVCKRKQ